MCEEFTRKQDDGVTCASDECDEDTEELIEDGTCQLLPCDETRFITLEDGTCKLKPDVKPLNCETDEFRVTACSSLKVCYVPDLKKFDSSKCKKTEACG